MPSPITALAPTAKTITQVETNSSGQLEQVTYTETKRVVIEPLVETIMNTLGGRLQWVFVNGPGANTTDVQQLRQVIMNHLPFYTGELVTELKAKKLVVDQTPVLVTP